MIRCRKCNSELTEQASFCNICGSPQHPKESERENSTPNGENTLDTNNSRHCKICGTELPKEAHFCAVCGFAQTPKKSSVLEGTSNEYATSVATSNYNEDLTIHLQPLLSIKPPQAVKTVNEHLSIASENASIRPKTVVRPPVFPSRPTSNGIKPSTSLQQPDTPLLLSSSEPSITTTQINHSGLEKIPETAASTVQSKYLVSMQDVSASVVSNQTHEALSSAARTPGLIRPITPNSSTRSVIPSRPDPNSQAATGQAIGSPQSTQVSRTPEYPISSPSVKVSSSVQNQAQQLSSSTYVQPEVGNRDKQQIAQLATQRTQVYSQPKIVENSVQSSPKEQIEPKWQNPTTYVSDKLGVRSTSTEHINGKNSVSDTPTIALLDSASFLSTSKAAEQWRKSWRDRQYAEAGPAENVSRGQASVPTPLTPMHQSLVRMRALKKNDNKQQHKRSTKLGTWIIIFLMICMIIGLGAYIIVSYMPNSPFGVSSVTPQTNTIQPTLVLVGTTSQTIKAGQSIKLHGEHFGANEPIIFLRDTATPIINTSGNTIFTHTDNQGAFDVAIPIDSHWSVGSHSIEALDKTSSQNAFLTLQVIPAGTPTTTSTELSITTQGKPTSLLTFQAIMGQGNPDPQRITITNTSGSPLTWTASASTNDNLNWLIINDNNNYGQLAISQPHSILISVNTTGLKRTDKKHSYLGQIIFMLNNTQLLTLPVQLQIADATPEMIFSPNPIIAKFVSGNTCQSNQSNQPLTLTLINLGSATISWAVNPDDKDKIKFVSNGQLLESGTLLPAGTLLPSGQPGDTVILTLQCNNIQEGQNYTLRVYANELSWSESVIIQ